MGHAYKGRGLLVQQFRSRASASSRPTTWGKMPSTLGALRGEAPSAVYGKAERGPEGMFVGHIFSCFTLIILWGTLVGFSYILVGLPGFL